MEYLVGGGTISDVEFGRSPSWGMQVMRREEAEARRPDRALDWLKIIPFEPAAASDRLGWVGLEAARYRAAPASELNPPALTHHRLVLFARPPEELDLRYEGVKRHLPPPAGSISLVPAGSPARWRWSGGIDRLHIFLEPGLVARVAAEAFGLDPARLTVPPLDGLDLPHLRAAMSAVDAELTAGGAGGRLAAESLANLLAVHLIRHVWRPAGCSAGGTACCRGGGSAPSSSTSRSTSTAARPWSRWLRSPASTPTTSPGSSRRPPGCRRTSTSSLRRVERAKQLLQAGTDLSLAEVAAHAGFSDQSQFSRHFKRLVGVTPGQFRTPSRIA